MTNSSVLVASDVNRSYQQGEEILPVLSGLNLTIDRGEKVAVVGGVWIWQNNAFKSVGGAR